MVARGGFSIWCCRISRLVTRERRVQRNHRRLPKCPTPPYLTGTANGTRRCINGSPHDRARPSETTRLVDAHRYRPSCRWSKCTLKRARDHSGVFVDSIGFEPYEMRRLRRSESPVGSWETKPGDRAGRSDWPGRGPTQVRRRRTWKQHHLRPDTVPQRVEVARHT